MNVLLIQIVKKFIVIQKSNQEKVLIVDLEIKILDLEKILEKVKSNKAD